MKRIPALLLLVALAALLAVAGCSSSTGSTSMETVGEGVPTDGKPVFYEFFTQS